MSDYDDQLGTDNTINTYDILSAPEELPSDMTINLVTPPDQESISNRLAKSKASKLNSLSRLNNYSSLDDSFTQLPDGSVESNANKIYNDLSDNEFQSLLQYTLAEKTLTPDESGRILDKSGNEFSGSTRRFYSGLTKDPESSVYKAGLSRGDRPDSSYRYLKELGGRPSGELGLDVNRFESDSLLDYGAATMLEAVGHGRKKALEGRAVPDIYEDPFTQDLYGSGSTEYYKNREAFLGAPTEVDMELGKKLFDEYMSKLPDTHRQFNRRGPDEALGYLLGEEPDRESEQYKRIKAIGKRVADERGVTLGSVAGTAGNTVKGFGAAFVRELVVNPTDAIGDLTGLWDLGTDKELSDSVDNLFGYDSSAVEESMTKVGDYWDIASNSELATVDRVKAAANGVLEVFTTPEMLGTSLGTLMAWVSPGAVLKAIGVGSKYAKTLSRIDKLEDAGKITKMAARGQKAKAFMTLDGAKNALVTQSGYITAALGNVNQQYEEFVKNNNGVELEGKEKAGWFAGRFSVQLLNQNIDKLIDFKAMKGAGTVKALTPAIKAMTKREWGNVVSTLGKGLLITAQNAGLEAAQEYAQTSMELHNTRFGSEQFKDLDTYVKFLSDSRNIREGGIAALAGAGGSGQFELAGALTPSGATNNASEVLKKISTSKPTATEEVSVSGDDVTKFKKDYENLLKRVVTYTAENSVNETNVSSLLDDLDELNATKHIIKASTPEQVAAGEGYYNSVVDQLEKFVTNNPGLKLSKRLVRKTVQESQADKEAASRQVNIPSDTAKAFNNLAKVTGTGENTDSSSAIDSVLKTFKTGTYSSVVPEAGVIDDELKALEQNLTGKVSGTAEETFDVIKDNLRGKTVNNFTQPSKAVDGSILSSQPNVESLADEDLEEVDYDDYTRKVTAERIIRTVLGSKENVSNTFKTNAAVFGFANGIPKKDVINIIKSYEAVEDEAVSGSRGYATRLSRLRGLIGASNPNKQAIAKERDEIASMYSAILNSETALERGIQAAEQKAADLNKQGTVIGKVKPVVTEYKKSDDKPYVIHIKKSAGVWIADTVGAKRLLKTKKRYTKDISKGLSGIAVTTSVGSSLTAGRITIPLKEGVHKAARQKDINYINKVTTIADEVAPNSVGVTKVVLGEKTHAKWAIKGDYYKANTEIINSDSYTANDIVLVDSTELFTRPNKTYGPKLGKNATKSLKAAISAGATIILDSDMVSDKNQKLASAIAGRIMGKDSGYEALSGTALRIFVKSTPENKKAIRKYQERLKSETEAAKLIATSKEKVVSLFRALNKNLDIATGETLSEERRLILEEEYNNTREILLESSFKGNEENLDKFLARESTDSVIRAAKGILNDPDAVAVVYEDKVFQQEVESFIRTESTRDRLVERLLKDWNDLYDQGLNRKKRESAVSELLTESGLESQALVESVLREKSFSVGKKDLYESIYQSVTTGELSAVPLRNNITDEQYAKLIAKNSEPKGHVRNSKKHVFLGVRRVVQDFTKLVEVSKTTVVNSVPVNYLPSSLRYAVESLKSNAEKALRSVSPAELAEQTYSIGEDGKVLAGAFNLHNSPARGLFFNNDGKVNEEVLAAVYLGLGDIIVGSKSAMSRGWKSDYDISQMLGIQEFEVTQEMRQFAYENGSLLKTAANSLGKNILSHIGLTKRVGKDVSSHEYEALISDIGNTALLIAEEQGLLKNTEVKSNEIARLYRDGQKREVESVTHFVHIDDVKDTSHKYVRNVPSKGVEKFIRTYEELAELIPEANTTRKEVHFTAPDKERLEKAKNEVRNDISGKEVPEEAKEALEILMDTAYSADIARIDEVLEAVAADNSQVKKLLGYIPLDSVEFEGLYYKDKEVQEAKNNAIDNSLKELQLLRDKITRLEGKEVDLYFDYFYSSNDRYMMDSNTVNPQVDKLMRFLVIPKGHRLEYNITVSESGGLEFSVDEGFDEDQDQSFTVRMALAQAFGQSVDKMDAEDIITFGNVVLSLNSDQLVGVKEEILKTGETVVEVDGTKYELEAKHLSHTLQALNFLEEVIQSTDGKIVSSLSLEFDSLTSGFANKVQQLPILTDMDLHFARTGVLTKKYQQTLQEALNFKGAGVEFDPSKGQSVADILAIKYSGKSGEVEFLDSYKNMAKTTISKLQEGTKQQQNLTHSLKKNMLSGESVFEIIKPLLPGGEYIDSIDSFTQITSTIRNLFKNPFMIFNYSASIGRIVRNLSNDVSHDLMQTIAVADLSKKENEGVKLVAQSFVDSIKIIDPDNDKKLITTVKGLQTVLKNHRLKDLKLKFKFPVEYPKKVGGSLVSVGTVEAMLEAVVSATYGDVIKDVFTESFQPFTEVQDSMNDTFKIAFRIFDKKRTDMLKELQKTKSGRFLTVEDHAEVLKDLWDDFPWIVGPLSGADSKKDIISVVTTSTRSPEVIEESRKKPQAILHESKNRETRTVTPLVKYLEEAVSSGSVLPFHAIDGAEMAKTLTSMNSKFELKATAAIHDAVIPPLNRADDIGFEYQKSMVDINTEYVLSDAVEDLVERIETTLNHEDFAKKFKDVTTVGLSTLPKKSAEKFPKAAREVINNMKGRINHIKKEREKWYGEKGLLEGAWYGNLVGTPGGMFKKGMTQPDLSYKQKFKDAGLYKSLSVTTALKKVESNYKPDSSIEMVNITAGIQDANAVTAVGVLKFSKGCK